MKRLTFLLPFLFVVIACNKGGDDTGASAGKGGNAILKVTPRHHSKQIDSCMVYLKYNAVDPPSDGRYDDSAKTTLVAGISVARFSGLKKGNYYVYGYGWDPTLAKNVKGGFAYGLTTENEQSLDIAVSEDH